MGRHAAADGAAAHPLVAEALAGRPGPSHRAHRPGSEGPIGWPGTGPTEGGGLGWPGDLPEVRDQGDASGDEAEESEESDDEAEHATATRGRRRLFARRPAA